ncbi:glycosyltransferase family 39 protein [Nitrosovibrio tenuis]|uniref:Dolichol-phosphate mannosyltransferase n=1 Tax=Nitrosovibrio tenuis TaxID=1233 RepID=A0A1H7PIX3_9PROT|nr:glycosyltransferase family 39 protein [Nitrosovibrio tenuis]SEL35569.1 dolichol-phosphate mannosyltransferase [Nitrosovibrio tenuis]
MTQFSIVIPTLNEAENIDPLLTRLFSLDLQKESFEVIIVDDGSADGTPARVRAWESRANVRLVERREKPDLTGSILAGAALARGNVIVVMDADLSHPPERVPALIAPVLDGSHDVAVGSRYIPGGSTEGWPLHRQWLSRLGGWLARPLCDVNDATSGFFAFRRELAATIAERARGYKILLELLVAGQGKLRVIEVPICFSDRTRGASKLSFSHQWTYLQRLMTLAGGTVSFGTASRFAVVGLFGVVVDALLFQWLMSNGAGLALAHIMSFFAAASVNYTLNSKWSFRLHHAGHLQWRQFSRFLTVGVFALLMRGGVLALLIYSWHIPSYLAIFPAIAATAVINYLGSAFYVFPVEHNPPSPDVRWRVASLGIIGFSVLLRLIYIGTAELFPDEAYYWNYTQHMDLSFYDHPPMVAWLIWLGTSIFGNSEFGVRFGAFCCGLITMGYMYALARNLYDKSTAIRTVLLLAVLPFYFATGAVMTADAPLVAAWAATLYYMERALIGDRRSAWLGVGIAFGLGILSKYTLGLLGLSALVFVIFDPAARRWLRRPHPYLAATLALLLFSPVIIWNMGHNWASLSFQSSRIQGVGDDQFSLHLLILHLMVLLTPVGLLAAIMALLSGRDNSGSSHERRRRLFVLAFGGVPLAVFVVLSIFDSLRFHWTGPIWLGMLPTMAWLMGQTDDLRAVAVRLRSAWKPTIAICLFLYAFALHYLVLGIPGIPYRGIYEGFPEHYFWREATQGIEEVVEEVRQQTGQEPIVVGMSKWSVASVLTFYNRGKPMEIRSRNMFGDSGAMYDFWYPSEPPTARPIILVGMWPHNLERTRQDRDIGKMLVDPGPVQDREIVQDGKSLRQVYYRVAYGYLGEQHLGNLK